MLVRTAGMKCISCKSKSPVYACGGCKSIDFIYCSKHCASSDWEKRHKFSCVSGVSFGEDNPEIPNTVTMHIIKQMFDENDIPNSLISIARFLSTNKETWNLRSQLPYDFVLLFPGRLTTEDESFAIRDFFNNAVKLSPKSRKFFRFAIQPHHAPIAPGRGEIDEPLFRDFMHVIVELQPRSFFYAENEHGLEYLIAYDDDIASFSKLFQMVETDRNYMAQLLELAMESNRTAIARYLLAKMDGKIYLRLDEFETLLNNRNFEILKLVIPRLKTEIDPPYFVAAAKSNDYELVKMFVSLHTKDFQRLYPLDLIRKAYEVSSDKRIRDLLEPLAHFELN
jgi:hypothetical protein